MIKMSGRLFSFEYTSKELHSELWSSRQESDRWSPAKEYQVELVACDTVIIEHDSKE